MRRYMAWLGLIILLLTRPLGAQDRPLSSRGLVGHGSPWDRRGHKGRGAVIHPTGDALRATAVGPHTVLRITIPNEGVPVKVGDVIEWGIDIANSELGLRSVQVTPHVAQNATNRRSAIDARTTRHEGYAASQRKRKRVAWRFAEAFGMRQRIVSPRRLVEREAVAA